MGMFQIKDTHGKRSSSMSFALRWKHENLRLILLSAIISIAMTFMLLVLLYGTAEKSVSVVVNGQEQIVSTKQWSLDRLLAEQSIEIGPHDVLSLPTNASIKDGDQVVIDHARAVTVQADGKSNTYFTTEKTVKDAMEAFNIPIREQDRVHPALSTPIDSDVTVSVVRVDTEVETTQHKMPFKVVQKEDPELAEGKQKVIQAGQDGLLVKQFEKVYEDGQLVSEKMILKSMETSAVEQVVAVGTKKPEPKVSVLSSPASESAQSVSTKDYSFQAQKTLKNVTLTAYTAHVASTGKSKGHPQYGITASGSKVQEGRTIAVDPKVIPIGWWVYIEGIGLRRAEDTGGAIKGNKIDVYYESESYAKKFGRKKGYTVHVIGPNKPKAS
ncbi:G5 domain-containing protein [Paenibacillus sp. 1P07SE]|uniref:G5 domain-containing protein n=1 Tax=Paenibacillus sp. 1P07SE TaxID=3132209 RepID=UPI0039A45EDA